ncbi:hypothetical protein B0H11DRAFT_2197313 [Mycena galericulata]|nr:hypothetical protein B0H11DRAFT_2197313 [Mycena galericulata]
MAALMLKIPELVAYVMEFLVGDSHSLQSCAGVNRSMKGAAQHHLFREIDLASRYPSLPAFLRLREALAASPHLKTKIRSIKFWIDESYLSAAVLALGLENVKHLGLRRLWQSTIPDDDMIADVATLIGKPSICSVFIYGCLSPAIFRNPSINLNTVRIHNSMEALPFCEVACESSRPKITALDLDFISPTVTAWLLDSSCPFDCSELLDIKILASIGDTNPPRLILQSARTIQYLECGAGLCCYIVQQPQHWLTVFPVDNMMLLDLQQCIALTRIYIYGETKKLITLLHSISSQVNQILQIRISGDQVEEGDIEELVEFSASPKHSLPRIMFVVSQVGQISLAGAWRTAITKFNNPLKRLELECTHP